jgi:hypothetical protein
MRWVGYTACMGAMRNRKFWWGSDIRMDARERVDWIHLA